MAPDHSSCAQNFQNVSRGTSPDPTKVGYARFVSQTTLESMHNLSTAARLQPFTLIRGFSFVTNRVSHKAYPVFIAPLQLQIQTAVTQLDLHRWMAEFHVQCRQFSFPVNQCFSVIRVLQLPNWQRKNPQTR